MAQRERETADMEAMVRRVLRAIVKRARDGDMEAAAALNRLRRDASVCLADSVDALRDVPWEYSWDDIGQALGVTRQAAQQRFGVTEAPAEG